MAGSIAEGGGNTGSSGPLGPGHLTGSTLLPEKHPRAFRRARRRSRRRAPLWLSIPAVLTALAVSLPLAYLLVRSASGGWSAYRQAVFSGRTLELLVSTLALVAGTVTLALTVAVPLAWLVARTDLPGRRFWAVAGALPLVFPSYVSAFALVAVLGPRGYLQQLLGVERLPDFIYGYGGAVCALGLFTYPYIFLLLVAGLRDLNPAYEESSRTLGAGRWRTFFRVVLPPLRPAIFGGSLLVILYTLSDFGAVSIVRYDTFTYSIYNAYRGLFDRSVAASLATVLVALTVGFILLEALLLRRLRPSPPVAARPAQPLLLGRWRRPALAFVTLLSAITLGIPLIVLISWALRAVRSGGGFETVASAAAGSLTAALLAALVAMALSLPVTAWSLRFPGPVSRLTNRLSHAGFALPGIVIALSLVFFSIRYARPIYQTLGLLVAAYVVRFLPEALVASRAALQAVAPRFEESSRSLGRGAWKTFTGLTVPLARRGVLAGGGLVFLTAMKELPATLILRPIGFETLATRIWSNVSDGIYSQAAAPALALVAVSALPVYFLIIRPALAPRRAR
ncbi:MAG: iron ABC transporter permease [Acidobacteriota bacterium]